jgi:hypothetical protein
MAHQRCERLYKGICKGAGARAPCRLVNCSQKSLAFIISSEGQIGYQTSMNQERADFEEKGYTDVVPVGWTVGS